MIKFLKLVGLNIGYFQSWLLLFLTFFFIIYPAALIAKIIFKDTPRKWSSWKIKSDTLDQLKKQF